MTTGPTKFALAKRLLDGGAFIVFENAGTVVTSETNETFKQAIGPSETKVVHEEIS